MKMMIVAVAPLLAGIAFAQNETRTESKTTTTTWDGTLVDAACHTTQTQRTTQSPTKTETTNSETVQCPVTAQTKTFGLITADGKFIRFDEPSNTRVIEIVKTQTASKAGAPMRVHVVGTSRGDVAVVETLRPEATAQASVQAVGEADRVAPGASNLSFDVKHDGDRGKLIVSDRGVTFEDVSDAKRSRTWTYAQIREFERESNNKVRIKAYTGDSFDFQLDGQAMSDAAYKVIADRIVAARAR